MNGTESQREWNSTRFVRYERLTRKMEKRKKWERYLRLQRARARALIKNSTILNEDQIIHTTNAITWEEKVWIWLLDDEQLGDVRCGICKEDIEPGTRVAWSSTEACDHLFCYDCIKPWVVDGGHNSCPFCRTSFV
jgi:hypothetical protein